MELAKITSKGQITIPIAIRNKLGLKDGDKVLFLEEAGRVVMMNATMSAIREAQDAFAGEAQRAGLATEQDVVQLVAEIRRERQDKTE